jgi:hypothetical protein
VKVLAAVAVTLLVAAATSATAATLITGKQIRNGSITGKDVKNRSLTQSDVRFSRGNVITVTAQVPAGDIQIISADCDPGHTVISGGWSMISGTPFVDKTYDDASWSVGVDNFDGIQPSDVEVQAWCAPTGRLLAANTRQQEAQIERDIAARRASR